MAFNIIYKSNDEEEEKKRKKLIEEGANQQLERNRQANEQFNRNYEERNNFFNNVGRVADSFLTGLGTTAANVGTGILSVINDDPVNLATRSARDNLIGKIENTDLAGYAEKLKAIKTPTEQRIDWLSDIKRQNEAKIQNLQSQTDSEFAKNVIGFVPNLSQQAVNIGASLVNPGLGMAVATAGAKGSYLDVAKQRGMNEEESRTFSNIMSVVEGATEMIGINNITKGIKGVNALAKTGIKGAKKEIQKEIVDTAIKSYGKSILDNAVQEAITEPIQEAVADITAKKGDWNNILGRSLESGFSGALTAAITGGASMGISAAVGYVQKVTNGYKPTQTETIQAVNQIYNEATENQKQVLNYAIKDGVEIATQQSILPTEENGLKSNVETNNTILDTAERNGIDIKDEKTRNNLETIQKFNENRGIEATFDADAFKGHDNINSFFRTDENGNREIVFNPNTMTDKTIEQLAVHEVYHDMVAGGTAQELTDFVVQKMSGNQEYQDYINALQDVYGEQDSNIIKEEAVAHYLEKNLGTNEFITELQQRGDRTTIQKIIDAIKDMITKVKNTLTGKGDLNYLLDLQRKYEQAYRGEFKGTQEQTKLSKQVNAQDNQGRTITSKDAYKTEPKEKTIRLYTNTSADNIDSILRDGLLVSKAKQKEYSGNMTWFETTPDLKGYGGTTIAVDVPNNIRMDKVNNTQYTVYDDISPENIVFIDKPIFSIYRTSDLNELVEKFGKDKVLEVYDKSKNKAVSREELVSLLDNIDSNTNNITKDNQGRTLTKEQQDYFKNSKVRDENGNLIEVYHGTNNEFNTYKNIKSQPGYWFTENKEYASEHGKNVKKQYLNLTNPINDVDLMWELAKDKFGNNATESNIFSNEFKEFLIEKGYDGIIFDHSGANTYIAFEPNQIKNIDNTNPTENADIRYSKEAPTKDNQGRELSKEQQERYKDISPKLRDENGNIKTYYHGTQRADRVGTIFDPNKATSGPMAFFTDNPEIAESYSKNKSDTSLSRDYDTEWDLFKANNNNLDTYWRLLSESKKNEIRQKGYEAGLDEDYNVAFGKDMSKNSFGNEYEYLLKRNNNNAIKALYEIYVNSGNLWQEEIRQFKDVLDYVGVENTSYLDPYKTDSKVYETYLNIKNPFDTSEISQEMVDKLEEASKKVDYNADEAYYADMWDKTSIEPSSWIERLKEDIEDGTTHSWTRIPDWVTDVLKSEGYDGIVDTGGKNGGQEHQVAIPFYSDQIKDVTNLNPTDNPDINLSKQGTGTSQQTINEFLENTKVNEGTGTAIKDLARVQKQSKQILPTTPAEEVTEMERPQLPQSQKSRKFYRSVIESDNTTSEAKQISRELMGYDSYTPQTNKLTLEQADRNIELNGTEGSLTTLTNKINNNDRITATDIAIGQRLMQYYSKIGDKARLQEAIQDTAMAGTEAGRSVQAFAMLNHQTPEGQVTWIQRSIDKINKRLQKEGRKEQFEFTPEMQQEILNSTNENRQQVLDKVYKELGEQVPKSHMEQFNEWRYFSMLFNPQTHIRNITGNVVMKQVQNIKNKVAGTIEDIVIGDNKERWNSLKRASKGTYEFAKNDLKNADVQSELGLNENKYNPQNRLQQNQRTFKSNALENTLGRLFNANSKALEVEDGWGLKSAYAKAMANYLTANKLDYNNLTDTQLQKARNYAVQQAKEATFHQENLIANYLQTIENKNLVTKIAVGGILPFKKTPMNVALTGFEYSPAGFIKTFTSDIVNLRKGKISPNQFIDNISKNLTGTGIAVLGYALTQSGILKASGGDDDKEKYEEAQGKQNYSIQIGDNTYSLDWLTPAGIPLFIGSELYQISHKDEKETAKGENQALKSISSILDATSTAMNPMSEMSMISGLTSALKSYSQGSSQTLANIGTNTLKSYVTQAVPTALGQIARTLDDKERSTTTTETNPFTKALDSTKNQIMNKIPGLRQLLPVSTDVWGNERKTTNYAENAIFPWKRKEIKEEPLDKELTRLYDATGESSVIPDTYIDKTLTIAKEKYRLSNEEYADLKKQYGQTSYKILSNLTSSSDYKNMTDEQKVKAVTEAYKYAKASLRVTYADWNNLDADANSTYKKVQNVIDKGGDAKDYFTYVGLTDGLKTETEKNRALRNSDLGSKSAIYESTTGSDDQIYPIMKKAKTNINAYLDYKLADIQGVKNEEGKTISGSKKQAFNDYLNSSKMNYNQKLLLKGVNYKLTNYEKNLLLDYLDTLKLSDNEYNDVLLKLK